MTLTLEIAGADRTNLLVPDSLSVTDELNSRNTCSCSLVDASGMFRPVVGETITVSMGTTTVFGGTIDRVSEAGDPGNPGLLRFSLECVDHNQLADRHLVARAYFAETAKNIVRDIVNNDLAGEGLTVDSPFPTNHAAGTIVTASSTPAAGLLSYLTDGGTGTNPYLSLAGGPGWVQVDLGQTIEIDTLRIWHYYGDGRTYHGTKTEVSLDGATWDAVFDSAVSGTYPETSTGHWIQFGSRSVRYIRDWANGNTVNTHNHWVEIQAYKLGDAEGPIITKATFNYQTAAECLNELADLTGYAWNIGYDKVVRFFSMNSNAAPWGISDSSKAVRNLKVERNRGEYRNCQYLRAGMDTTSPRTESFKGDGSKKTFSLAFPVAEAPTVTVQIGTGIPVSKSVGVRGVDSGADWYWNKGQNEITQDDAYGVAPLRPEDTLSVTYRGLFPVILQAEVDEEREARKSIEGGTGVYEAVEEDSNIDSADLAKMKADGLLRKYGRIPCSVIFETRKPGLAAGQLLDVNLSRHGLTGQFLIESVSVRDEVGKALVYGVKALDGETLGGWASFFKKLGSAGRQFVIRENEVLLILRRNTEVITLPDELLTSAAPPAVAGLSSPSEIGFCEVG